MKKIILILFVLAALILLAAPAVVGMQAEAHYQALVAGLEKNGFRVVRNHYRRGWLGASAETEFELAVPADAGAPPKTLGFVLRNRITHAPYSREHGVLPALAVIDTRLLPGGEPLFPADGPAPIQTRIGLDGAGRILIDFPELEQPARNGEPAIRFGGAKGTAAFSPGHDELTIDFRLPFLRIREQGGAGAEISAISLDARAGRTAAGLMLGSSRFGIGRILVRPGGGGGLDIGNLLIEAETSAAGEMVEGRVSYALDSVRTDGAGFGPMVLDARFGNLPAAALAAIRQGVEEINSRRLPPDQQGMALFGVVMSNAAALLAADPRLSVDRLRLVTPEGVIEGWIELQTEGLQWAEISNPSTVLSKLLLDAGLRMPEKLLRQVFEQQARRMLMAQAARQRMPGEQAPEPGPDPERLRAQASMVAAQQIDSLLTQEILVRDGTAVETAASLRDGLLTVNGKTIPLPMMVQSQ